MPSYPYHRDPVTGLTSAIHPNTYECWIAGQKDETIETIRAVDSFTARKLIAHKYRLDVTDAAARRIRD